jgi:hypothetical protein
MLQRKPPVIAKMLLADRSVIATDQIALLPFIACRAVAVRHALATLHCPRPGLLDD